MFRQVPVATHSATGTVWTTMVHNGRNDELSLVVWHTDIFDPRRDSAYLESLYLQLERRLAMKIGEPVSHNDPEELLAALGREAKQYEAAPKRWTTPETIDREFMHHPPNEKTIKVHERVRELLRTAAHELNDLLPECPRKTDAIGALRTAMWAANSAVACYGHDSLTWVPAVKVGGRSSTWHADETEVAGKRLTDEQAAEAVFQAMGTVSAAWEHIDRAGVFQDDAAADACRRLLERLGYGIPEGYRPRPATPVHPTFPGPVDPVNNLKLPEQAGPEAGERESSEPE